MLTKFPISSFGLADVLVRVQLVQTAVFIHISKGPLPEGCVCKGSRERLPGRRAGRISELPHFPRPSPGALSARRGPGPRRARLPQSQSPGPGGTATRRSCVGTRASRETTPLGLTFEMQLEIWVP